MMEINVHSVLYLLIMLLAGATAYGLFDLYRKVYGIEKAIEIIRDMLVINGKLMHIIDERFDALEEDGEYADDYERADEAEDGSVQ